MIPIDLQMQGLLLTFILSLIMLGIYIIIHLFSYLLQDNSLRAKAKTEYGQIIFNLIIFILIIFIAMPIIDNEILPTGIKLFDPYATLETSNPNYPLLSQGIPARDLGIALDQNGNCLYSKDGFKNANVSYAPHTCVAISFFDRLEWLTTETMTQTIYLYNQLGIISSIKVMVQGIMILPKPPFIVSASILSMMPYAGFSAEMSIISDGFSLMTKAIIMIIMQRNAVDIVAQALFPIFLISGIVFRSFIFTRKFGGFLIAAALSLYYIAPLIYIIGHRAMYESGNFVGIESQSLISGSPKVIPYANLVQKGDSAFLPTVDIDSINIDWFHPIETLNNMWKGIKEYYNNFYSIGDAQLVSHIKGDSLIIANNGYLHTISKIGMLTIMIPLLTLLAVLGSIKTMAPFFGGDASIAGLTHFL
ncbi:MAG: hypothetical protein WC356_03120 [Candidatus Micrarchaeia archaeon]|jgi:voltage-gated potassium channel Kch